MGEEELFENLMEFWQSGEGLFKERKFNSAASLYFKAIVAACDLSIFKKQTLFVKNHDQRFKILRLNFPQAYEIVSDLFSTYTRGYRARLGEDDAVKMRGGVIEVAKLFKIELNSKED